MAEMIPGKAEVSSEMCLAVCCCVCHSKDLVISFTVIQPLTHQTGADLAFTDSQRSPGCIFFYLFNVRNDRRFSPLPQQPLWQL